MPTRSWCCTTARCGNGGRTGTCWRSAGSMSGSTSSSFAARRAAGRREVACGGRFGAGTFVGILPIFRTRMPMMHLEVGGRTYPIAVGEMVIGAAPDASVVLPGGGEARQAIVQGWADGGAAVRAVPGAEVSVNGVRLGNDPPPILHGDKLRVGEAELLVV